MAVRIRLRRVGKKKMPMYHIVAADSRAARNGKFLEVVGKYDPLKNPMVIETKETRVFHWLKNGALPTDTVRSLFQRSGLWIKWTMTKSGEDAAKIAAAMEQWQAVQAEKLVRTNARKARRTAKRKKAAAPAEQKEAAPAAAPEAAPQA